jgi:uncharacterized membrane protein YccC
VSANDALERASELLTQVEALRERLDGTDDPEQAIEILQELSELAKEVDAEIERARRAAEADAADA